MLDDEIAKAVAAERARCAAIARNYADDLRRRATNDPVAGSFLAVAAAGIDNIAYNITVGTIPEEGRARASITRTTGDGEGE